MASSKQSVSSVQVGNGPNPTFAVNFGTRASDNMPIEMQVTWSDLILRFSKPDLKRGTLSFAEYQALSKEDIEQARKRKAEKDGDYFIMAAFTGNGVRNEENVLYLTGFVGDIDTGLISRDDLEACFDGYKYLVYSSYSHSPDKPVWRFVLPYAKPTTVAAHKRVYAFLQNALKNQLDDRCEKPSQLWYTPACPFDAANVFEFFTGTGILFDADEVPKVSAASNLMISTQAPSTSKLITREQLPEAMGEQLRVALSFISSDDRQLWVTIGIAIKGTYGDAGFSIWDAWASTSPKYEPNEAERTWNSLKPRDEGGVTLGTVFHLAMKGGYSKALMVAKVTPPSASSLPTATTPLFKIEDAMVDRFLRSPAPQRRWLLHNTLPLGKVGMLVAPGGTGKSFLMIQLAIAVATHSRLADQWQVDTQGASLILCAEEDDEDLHHRLQDVLANTVAYTPALQKLVEQRVFIKSMLTENNLMTQANDRGEMVLTDYVDRLALTAQQIPDLKLIIIDPASRFRGGNENAAQDTTRFVEALERLRSATGATVLLVHHTNKGSMKADEVDQGASRGSSALTDGVRWQMSLSKPTSKQLTAAGVSTHSASQYVLATITKNNGAPPQDPVLLMRGPGGILEAAIASKPSQSQEAALIGLIQSEADAKRRHTANSLEKNFSGTNGPLKLSAAALRALISNCVKRNYLSKRTTKPVNALEWTGVPPP